MQSKYAKMECSLFFFVCMSCVKKECQPWDAYEYFIVFHVPQVTDVIRTAETDRFALPDVPVGSKTERSCAQQKKPDHTSHRFLGLMI
jgi:hypothetical protein